MPMQSASIHAFRYVSIISSAVPFVTSNVDGKHSSVVRISLAHETCRIWMTLLSTWLWNCDNFATKTHEFWYQPNSNLVQFTQPLSRYLARTPGPLVN